MCVTTKDDKIVGKYRKGPKVIKYTFCVFCTLLIFVCIHVLSNYIDIPVLYRFKDLINVIYYMTPKSGISEKCWTLVAPTNETFTVKLKPGLMDLVNPTTLKYAPTVNGSYYMENKNFCSDESDLKILVMIISATYNFQRRNAIRETWGNPSHYLNYGKMKIIFLLGLSENSHVQQEIQAEFERNQDILQGSFIDSYKNVSYKSVLGFKWLTERCQDAKYIIKTDDDVVINIFHIFENIVPTLSLDQCHVHCERRDNSKVRRRKNVKAYVEPHQLKGLKYHMPYCHGQYVMFLNDIVPYLYTSASITPFFWIDDVFNYGIVMNNIHGLRYKQVLKNEYVSFPKMKTQLCLTQKSSLCHFLYIVTGHVNQIRSSWLSLKIQYRHVLK